MHRDSVTAPGYRGGVKRALVIAGVACAGLVMVLAGAATAFVTGGGLDRWRDSRAIAVPQEYRPVIRDAAERCPTVPATVLAAQLASESGWDPTAVSPAGARGLAQFMPEVWEQYGLDGDGDGKAQVNNPIDAIHSAAALNCINAELVADVPGDQLRNILAAYNAGFNQVVRYGGVPPFPETQQYVDRVIRRSQTIEL